MSEPNNNQLATTGQQSSNVSVFSNTGAFESATRMASALAKSEIVPKAYQGNVANTLVALEMANRMNVSPLMVMQNLDIIKGKPSFNSKFTAAMINGTGKYTKLRYHYEDRGEKTVEYQETSWNNGQSSRVKKTIKVRDLACRAYAKELSTGEVLEGPWVSIEMAVREGWYTKSDSKWPTMPELMLSYRAVAFWSRLYEPGVTMGMHTTEELEDITPRTVDQVATVVPPDTESLNDKISRRSAGTTDAAPEPPITITEASPNEPSSPANSGDDEFLPD